MALEDFTKISPSFGLKTRLFSWNDFPYKFSDLNEKNLKPGIALKILEILPDT